MKNYEKGSVILFLILLSFYIPVNFNLKNGSPIIEKVESQVIPFIPPEFDQDAIFQWKKSIREVDQNNNGINDQFERKLNFLSKFTISDSSNSPDYAFWFEEENKFGILNDYKKQIIEQLSQNCVPVILYFPNGDLQSISSLFSQLGGLIKSTYQYAINGFAGTIDYVNLTIFCDMLLRNEVPFLIEEDSIFQASLYYASRNMNLRPYVWNILSYTGDEFSSIAVIDTGIDDSHTFFMPGYANANFNFKIVGWRDEVNNLTLPYDDNGHGSNCAGIATGSGAPILDEAGRTVATFSTGFDYTGYNFPSYTINITAARFNVTEPGLISIYSEHNDFTPGLDAVYVWTNLYHYETLVDTYAVSTKIWNHTLSFNVTSDLLGDYSLRITLVFADNGGDFLVSSPHMGFRAEIHWPFNPPSMGSGDLWQGIAPKTHLVGVKVLDAAGSGMLSDILAGLNWIIANKLAYNITTISMSLGGGPGQISIINAVNTAVENGIVTVVAAGNSGGIGNNIGSPGDADNVITVAAMSFSDNVTDYSSSGGNSYTGTTIKPDILAPGGSNYNFSMFSTDTNDNDASGEFSSDRWLNEMAPMVGTSMATPTVAGATNLLIKAMGGRQNWNYTGIEAKRVKALLLMTATETFPLTREGNAGFSPALNRGGKDTHEGYGRINIDMALEAYTQKLTPGTNKGTRITSSFINSFAKHGFGSYLDLDGDAQCNLVLDVPNGTDFDLYLYSDIPTSIGEPALIASSTSDQMGVDEIISYVAPQAGKYYIVVKAISGEGYANLSYKLNLYAPILTEGKVIPSSGSQTTLFNFTVIYTDQDNFSPVSINITIDGSRYSMEQQDSLDTNYKDGKIYQFLIYLQPGLHQYLYSCSDGTFYNSTNLFPLNVTPAPNINSPNLTNGQIYPMVGSKFQTFLFSVNYTDIDNNAPLYMNITINSTISSMWKQDPFDYNYMDGCIFLFSTLFKEAGSYIYFFNSSDGINTAYLGPLIGPTVKNTTLFDGLFINHTWIMQGLGSGPSNFRYAEKMENTYHVVWDHPFGQAQWDEYSNSRIMVNCSGSLPFNSGSHSPTRIFTNVSIGNIVPISVNGEGDHPFNVTKQIIRSLPGFGIVEVWVLGDLTLPGSIIWYEKSSGILLNGTFKYFGGSYSYTFNFIDTNVEFGYIINNFSPELTFGSVNPTSGNQTILFNFSVIYEDRDNYPPLYINILINKTRFSMIQQNPLDRNYSNGCLYQYFTYLQPGSYNYSFECADWEFYNSTSTYFGLNVIPSFNNNTPQLNNGQVDPPKGSQGITIFLFTVNYTDFDNNIPSYINVTINSTSYRMTKQNILDSNLMDGCVYEFSTTLIELGSYNFHYNCSDGKFQANLGYFSGPIVEEPKIFDGLYINHTLTVPSSGTGPSSFSYMHLLGDTFLTTWNMWGAPYSWDESIQTRIISNDNTPVFGDGSHTPVWIFTSIALGQTIPIGVIMEGDHMFNVSNELIHIFPGIGPLEIWELVDLTTPGGIVWYEKSTGLLLNGTFYYFGGMYTYSFDFIGTNAKFTIVGNDYAPELVFGSVMPLAGNQTTLFNFSVILQDLDNFPPLYSNVLINGTPYPLNQQNPLDNNYTDGCLYQYLTYLQPGLYNYSFECADWTFYNSTETYFGINVTRYNLNPPSLSNGQVNPLMGYAKETNFLFSINYTDPENNAPSYLTVTINSTSYNMMRQNPMDSYYVDGCRYILNTMLPSYGNYSFYFNCSDGVFQQSAGPFFGPFVDILSLENYTMIPDYIYEWVDATTGIRSSMDGADDAAQQFYLPFPFRFYNETFNSIYVSTNGFVSFSYRTSYNNVPFPTTSYPFMIAPYWDDLWAITPCNIFVRNLTAPNRVIIEWVNINLGFGPLIGTFEIVLFESGSIVFNYDYLDFAFGYTCGLNFGLDTRYFNAFTRLNTTMDNFSILFTPIPNLYAPSLTLGSLLPITGNQTTMFNFSIVYSEPENTPPSYITVIINGSSHPMIKQNLFDVNYTDGCLYQYITSLLPGYYNYYFKCSDGKFRISTNTYPGPNVTLVNLYPPFLNNGRVNPNSGYNGSTSFVFSVNYSDSDNNPPAYINVTINSTIYALVKQDLMDNNYIDGCSYRFNIIFDSIGKYIYYFNSSDGFFSTSIGPFIGPTVAENPLKNYTMTVDAQYYWIDATTGIRCNLPGADDANQRFMLPFTFQFYNESFSSIYVSTNGFVSFTSIMGYNNVPFPSFAYRYMIAPFWDDLKAANPCNIYVRNLTSPNRVVIEWQNYFSASGSLVGTFEVILFESGEIIFNYDYLDYASSYTCGLNFGPDMRYFNAFTQLNTSIDDFSIWFAKPKNNYVPTLLNGMVLPLIGNPYTIFNFTVIYTDLDNNKPLYVNILINGTPFIMNKLDTSDYYYIDGCIYQYFTNLTLGNYSYSFQCFDGKYINSTSNFSGLTVIVINLAAPQLRIPQVVPSIGGNTTLFNFTVSYSDADNNLPLYVNITINAQTYSMNPVNPLDNNVIDGALYYYITLLNYGFYQFQINCSDYLFRNATGWIYAPEVNPFFNYPSSILLLSPPNASNLFTGGYAFTWESLELPIGSINYTLQISNSTNFSYRSFERMEIQETPYNTSLLVVVNYTKGTYYWRVRPSFGLFLGNWSDFYTFELILNEIKPALIGGIVNPLVGNQFTIFNFTIIYYDLDNNTPVYIRVVINGTPYVMGKQLISDSNYVDGCLYRYLTSLSSGTYIYAFQCFDGKYSNSTANFTGLTVIESNNAAPRLFNPRVSPTIGGNSTLFNFTVWYFDADNNSPLYVNLTIMTLTYPMNPANPLDYNVIDGALYYYAILLDFGFYQFQVRCSDGVFLNSTEWFNAPEVNPFCNYQVSFSFLGPVNGSSLNAGWVDFSWYSLDLPIGPVNYTLQVSNSPNFSDILVQVADILETSSITTKLIQLDIPAGIYYWRICPTIGNFSGNWSNTNVLILSTIPPPGFWEQYGIWILIGACLAGVITTVIITKTRTKKKTKTQVPIPQTKKIGESGPQPTLPQQLTEVLIKEEKPAEEKPIKSILELPKGAAPFYCASCQMGYAITAPQESQRYSCPKCKQLLNKITNCPLCNQSISFSQDNYWSYFEKMVQCPHCHNIFTNSEPPKVPETLPEVRPPTRESTPSYLELDLKQFQCPSCQKEYHLETIDTSLIHKCPSCGRPLQRFLICKNCNNKVSFNQEQLPNFLGKRIKCPQCARKSQETELIQIFSRLKDNDPNVRLRSAELLGEIGNKMAGPFLLEVLMTDTNNPVRAATITALGMIGVNTALPFLKRLSEEDTDPEIRKRATQAIQWIENSHPA